MNRRFLCDECWSAFREEELLKSPNPFDPSTEVTGCPNCFAVDSMRLICDEPGCMNEADIGTPTPDGYRNTCYKHAPHDS